MEYRKRQNILIKRKERAEATIDKWWLDNKREYWWHKNYQAIDGINSIKGSRDVKYRIKQYKLKHYLKKDDDVLDIGCNKGLFLITLYNKFGTGTGVDVSKEDIKFANDLKESKKINNCIFIERDFASFAKEHCKKYNVIFSFAVEGHLKINMHEYAVYLDSLLKNSGVILFESHALFSQPNVENRFLMLKRELEQNKIFLTKEWIIKDRSKYRIFCVFVKSEI